jgi:hypothetical protein
MPVEVVEFDVEDDEHLQKCEIIIIVKRSDKRPEF